MDFQDGNKLKFWFKMDKIANVDKKLPIFFLILVQNVKSALFRKNISLDTPI
mgnify:CR=1 FL=1